MNAPKCEATDHIYLLVAAQKVFSCTETARVQPVDPPAPARDALHRLEPAVLWSGASSQGRLAGGLLALDDSRLDEFYARKIALAHRHRSGKHHRVEEGINRTIPTGLGRTQDGSHP